MDAIAIVAALVSASLSYLVVAGLVLGYHAERPPRIYLGNVVVNWDSSPDERVIGWPDRERGEARLRAYLWPLLVVALALSGIVYALRLAVRAMLLGPRAVVRSAACVGRFAVRRRPSRLPAARVVDRGGGDR